MEERLIDIEIKLSYQQDMINSLNDTVALLNQQMSAQQAQLRALIQEIERLRCASNAHLGNIRAEIPPHY